MWPRLSIIAGLLAGVAVALLVLGGILAFAPERGSAATPAPVPSVSIPVLSPSPAGASASPTAGSGASPTAGASGSGSAGLFHVGEPAPALAVPQVGGGTIDLANLRGKPVWVNFMGTYCPPCLDEFPLMNGFAARYADDGLVVLAIDVKEEEGAVAAFAESLSATFPHRARQRRLRADALGGAGAARPLLDRQGRDHPRRSARRDRAGHHGPRPADDHAGRRRHTVTAADGPPSISSAAEVARALDSLAVAPPPLLVVADFDGTLAIGARDPAVAVIERVAQRGLRALARVATERPARVHVAVLTGRVVSDVAARVRVGGVEYLGDHGLEHGTLARGARAEHLQVVTDRAFDGHRRSAASLADAVADELGSPPWLFVERKGPSVAFHVRQADDVAAARAAVVAAIATVEAREGLRDHGLAHYRGRSVVDLRPADAGGKREAVERLIERHRPGAVVVLGDEMSDVDAFEAVIAARRSDPALAAATVAVHGARGPAPEELLRVADLYVGSPREVGRLLLALARRL